MADEPVIASAIDLTSQQLLCQLCEEVGFLRGALQSLDCDSDDLDDIVEAALRHHDQLSAIRRTFSMTLKEPPCDS